jgi:tripartite-type tricarboxylate transporter receptor subunit TctC
MRIVTIIYSKGDAFWELKHYAAWHSIFKSFVTQTLNSPQVKENIARGAYETSPGTPAELAADIKSGYEKWGAMIKQIGFVKQ